MLERMETVAAAHKLHKLRRHQSKLPRQPIQCRRHRNLPCKLLLLRQRRLPT